MNKKLAAVVLIIAFTLMMVLVNRDTVTSQENMPPQPVDGAEFFQRKPHLISAVLAFDIGVAVNTDLIAEFSA